MTREYLDTCLGEADMRDRLRCVERDPVVLKAMAKEWRRLWSAQQEVMKQEVLKQAEVRRVPSRQEEEWDFSGVEDLHAERAKWRRLVACAKRGLSPSGAAKSTVRKWRSKVAALDRLLAGEPDVTKAGDDDIRRTQERILSRIENEMARLDEVPEIAFAPVRGLNWTILPEGPRGWERLRTFLEYDHRGRPYHFDLARLERLRELGDGSLWTGVDGLERYFAFQLPGALFVVCENCEVGNATYVLPASHWRELSCLTKGEVVRYIGVRRFVHHGKSGWRWVCFLARLGLTDDGVTPRDLGRALKLPVETVVDVLRKKYRPMDKVRALNESQIEWACRELGVGQTCRPVGESDDESEEEDGDDSDAVDSVD